MQPYALMLDVDNIWSVWKRWRVPSNAAELRRVILALLFLAPNPDDSWTLRVTSKGDPGVVRVKGPYYP